MCPKWTTYSREYGAIWEAGSFHTLVPQNEISYCCTGMDAKPLPPIQVCVYVCVCVCVEGVCVCVEGVCVCVCLHVRVRVSACACVCA
jgi:hypothetical protein